MADRTYAAASAAYPAGTADVTPPATLRRISWGAVLAGTAVVLAVHLLLSLLGIGIGLTTVDPGAGGTPEASSLGIGAGIWWVVSNLIALVIGGYVAAHLSGMPARDDGIIHGVLTWAVSLLLTLYLLTSAVGTVVGGAFNVVGSTLSAAGEGIAQAAPEVAEATGFSPEQLEQRVEEILRPAEPGSLSPEAARSELVSALQQVVTGGENAEQARERGIAIIAQQAGIDPQEATARVDQLQAEVEQAADQAAQTATQAADATADTLASASIWAFVALLLGACAAAAGGAMGTRHRDRYAHR